MPAPVNGGDGCGGSQHPPPTTAAADSHCSLPLGTAAGSGTERSSNYEFGGQEFESLRARHLTNSRQRNFRVGPAEAVIRQGRQNKMLITGRRVAGSFPRERRRAPGKAPDAAYATRGGGRLHHPSAGKRAPRPLPGHCWASWRRSRGAAPPTLERGYAAGCPAAPCQALHRRLQRLHLGQNRAPPPRFSSRTIAMIACGQGVLHNPAVNGWSLVRIRAGDQY